MSRLKETGKSAMLVLEIIAIIGYQVLLGYMIGKALIVALVLLSGER